MKDGQASASVLVISDYGGRCSEDWDYLRDTLAALRAQTFAEPVEVVLVDSTPVDEGMPPDLVALTADMRIVRDPEATSCALMNLAVATASADLVALLDGDCAPAPGWLDAAVACLRTHP